MPLYGVKNTFIDVAVEDEESDDEPQPMISRKHVSDLRDARDELTRDYMAHVERTAFMSRPNEVLNKTGQSSMEGTDLPAKTSDCSSSVSDEDDESDNEPQPMLSRRGASDIRDSRDESSRAQLGKTSAQSAGLQRSRPLSEVLRESRQAAQPSVQEDQEDASDDEPQPLIRKGISDLSHARDELTRGYMAKVQSSIGDALRKHPLAGLARSRPLSEVLAAERSQKSEKAAMHAAVKEEEDEDDESEDEPQPLIRKGVSDLSHARDELTRGYMAKVQSSIGDVLKSHSTPMSSNSSLQRSRPLAEVLADERDRKAKKAAMQASVKEEEEDESDDEPQPLVRRGVSDLRDARDELTRGYMASLEQGLGSSLKSHARSLGMQRSTPLSEVLEHKQAAQEDEDESEDEPQPLITRKGVSDLRDARDELTRDYMASLPTSLEEDSFFSSQSTLERIGKLSIPASSPARVQGFDTPGWGYSIQRGLDLHMPQKIDINMSQNVPDDDLPKRIVIASGGLDAVAEQEPFADDMPEYPEFLAPPERIEFSIPHNLEFIAPTEPMDLSSTVVAPEFFAPMQTLGLTASRPSNEFSAPGMSNVAQNRMFTTPDVSPEFSAQQPDMDTFSRMPRFEHAGPQVQQRMDVQSGGLHLDFIQHRNGNIPMHGQEDISGFAAPQVLMNAKVGEFVPPRNRRAPPNSQYINANNMVPNPDYFGQQGQMIDISRRGAPQFDYSSGPMGAMDRSNAGFNFDYSNNFQQGNDFGRGGFDDVQKSWNMSAPSNMRAVEMPVRPLQEQAPVGGGSITDAQELKLQQHEAKSCRPCHYFVCPSGCFNGANCKFCHLSHVTLSQGRPSKFQRKQCQEVVEMLLKVFHRDSEEFKTARRTLAIRSAYIGSLIDKGLAQNGGKDLLRQRQEPEHVLEMRRVLGNRFSDAALDMIFDAKGTPESKKACRSELFAVKSAYNRMQARDM